MSRPWYIARDPEAAAPVVAALAARGVPAAALPCTSREVLPWPEALVARPDSCNILFCTSPFAARLVISQWPGETRETGDVVVTAAVAPVTAATLESAGLPVTIRAGGGARGLAEAVVAWIAERRSAEGCSARGAPRVLYPTSQIGLISAEQRAAVSQMRRVATVIRGVAYATRARSGLAAILRDALPQSAGVVFYSPSAVSAFLRALGESSDGFAPRAWKAICVGGSTARAWDRGRSPGRPRALRLDPGADVAAAAIQTVSS